MYKLVGFPREVWETNYRGPNEKQIEDMWRRVAKVAASIEKGKNKKLWEEKFYGILEDFIFIPGGRILANAGIKERNNTTLFNCFTHNPADINMEDPDSIEGIFDLLKAQAHTLKSEGGYGTNFSFLRPAGTYIKGIGVRTPGVLKFMELWDKSSEIITSGSEKISDATRKDEKKKIRKGAQMGVLSIWHPEIEDFIVAKSTSNRLNKFNLSVGITAGFMESLKVNGDWNLRYPDTTFSKYNIEWDGDIYKWEEKQYPVVIYKTLKAKTIWDMMMKSTYQNNEPGVIFLDLANKLNPLSYCENILQSNPCGEVLMSTGVCNLGSLNLVKFVEDGHFNHKMFSNTIEIAVRFLDNINDISNVPLPEYEDAVKDKRRIGLGVMGLGSLHYMLGIKYGSTESLTLIEEIWKNKAEMEIMTSAKLGKEKGDFKLFNCKDYFNTYWWKNAPISKDIKIAVEKLKHMRNATQSMNAPTGNTSILAGVVSGGIEPVFMREYIRWIIVNDEEKRELRKLGFNFPDTTKKEWFETEQLKFIRKGNDQMLKGNFNKIDYEVDRNRGLVKAVNTEDYGWKYVKESIKEVHIETYTTTDDLSTEDHLNTLGLISKYINMNSSKTINLPSNYNFDKFKDIYMKAYDNKIKGVTTYRAGTMASVLEKIEIEDKNIEKDYTKLETQYKKAGRAVIKSDLDLPEISLSKTFARKSEGKKWYLHVAFSDKNMTKPFAIFIHTNNKENIRDITELIDKIEQHAYGVGIQKEIIDKQIEKCKTQNIIDRFSRAISLLLRHNVNLKSVVGLLDNQPVYTLIFQVRKLLMEYVPEGDLNEMCTICGTQLVLQEGCFLCINCGYSKCG